MKPYYCPKCRTPLVGVLPCRACAPRDIGPAGVEAHADTIEANVAAYYSDEIDHAEFTARQRIAWDAVVADDVRGQVCVELDRRSRRASGCMGAGCEITPNGVRHRCTLRPA